MEPGFSFDKAALRSLPKEWSGLKMKLKYRKRTYLLTLDLENPLEATQEAA
jgi:hypothetical protein